MHGQLERHNIIKFNLKPYGLVKKGIAGKSQMA